MAPPGSPGRREEMMKVRFWASIEDEGIPPDPPRLEAVPGAKEVLQVLEVDHRLTEREKIEAIRLAWDGFFGESRPRHALWPVARLLLEAVRGLPRDEGASALSAVFMRVVARSPVEVLR
jgi:hypothetical protein